MRGILLALAFTLSVSSTASAQQYAKVAPESESSRSKSAASYLERGNIWFKQGEYERAIADYSLAIAFDTRFADPYCNRGMARALKGDIIGALQDFDIALALNPRLATALTSRGLLRFSKKEFAAGLAANARRRVEADPDRPGCARGGGRPPQAVRLVRGRRPGRRDLRAPRRSPRLTSSASSPERGRPRQRRSSCSSRRRKPGW